MTLKELLTISEFEWYSVEVTSKPEANLHYHVDHFLVERRTAPDYNGPFYGKHHREERREIVQKLKKYADCEVYRIICRFNSYPNIYVLEEK